jgi:hypothetical protein
MIAALLLLLGSTPAPAPGDAVRPFVVQTREGAPFAWKPGRITVICFCAMWCNTWKQQLPRLSKSEKELKGLPVDYLAISIDGRWLDKTKGREYASLLADPGGSWTASIGIDRVPYTLVVDAQGIIRSSANGTLRSDDIVDQVRSALRPIVAGPIYLTFDGLSDNILDVLRAQGIKATFFCDQSADNPVIDRARKEGDSVQSLSSSPPATPATLSRSRGNGDIRTRNGRTLHLFVDDPYDFTRPGQKELKRRILNNARPKAVIYLHAGIPDTLSILPEVIANLKGRGYTFELLR